MRKKIGDTFIVEMAPNRNTLTLKQKIEIIEVYNKEKLSVRSLSTRFNIGKTQAAHIIKHKEILLNKWMSNSNADQKRSFLTGDGSIVDKLCYNWFIAARQKGIPMTGPLIRCIAKKIAESLGHTTFVASSGWLNKFKIRHNISFKGISGEGASVNVEDVSSFLIQIPSLIQGYSPRDIYNADETGLYFRALPNETQTLKEEKCVGGEYAEERFTILNCVNMVGEKEKLLVIGNVAKSAFKSININNLPVTWKYNEKAWITRQIMTEWLQELDQKMEKEKRNILLFLDNAGSHSKDIKLRNIKIVFLPLNCPLACQPLDQGIVKNFKIYYRNLVLKHLLVNIENVTAFELIKKITPLDALYFAKTAWDQVTEQTIKTCFRKAGFNQDSRQNEDPLSEAFTFDLEDDSPLSELTEILKNKKLLELIDNENLNDFLEIDENLCIENPDSGQEIENLKVEPLSEDSDVEEVPIPAEDIQSYSEAITLTDRLKRFAENHGDTESLELLSKLEINFLEANLKKNIGTNNR